jgi:Holliday junction resolvase RusA-like endonuclease
MREVGGREMIVISGQTPSHKNSKQMFVSRTTGKMFPANNKKYLAWRNGAEIEVLNQAKYRYTGAVEIEMWFFVRDKRPRDLDNMVASVLDVLVAASVISDDNCFVVRGIHAYLGDVDQANPRAEIEICSLEGANNGREKD